MEYVNSKKILFFVFLIVFTLFGRFAYAQEFTSSNWKVLDPVINAGGFGSSTSFQLFGVLSQVASGTSTSTTLFGDNAGFLYFPAVTLPVLFGSLGDGQVSLSWSASVGYLGWTVSGYSVGQSTVSGGPYTYSSVGAVTSSVRTGLTNSTTYYFVVIPKDTFGNPIATSTQITVTPVSSSGGGGGGGGGGGYIPPGQANTGVIFSGRAYPGVKVTLLKDGQVATEVTSDPGANFHISLTGLSGGSFIFTVYAEDSQRRRSQPQTFPVTLTTGSVVEINNIFLAPTISVDKAEVKRGENVMIFGQTTPNSQVTIQVNSDQEFFVTTPSDTSGGYFRQFDTSVLELGGHSTKSKTTLALAISPFSSLVSFKVGNKTVLAESAKCPEKGDLNNDCRVNLIDFSIAAFWYKKSLSKDFAVIEMERLNSDKKVDLIDFSIMAYNWTG